MKRFTHFLQEEYEELVNSYPNMTVERIVYKDGEKIIE